MFLVRDETASQWSGPAFYTIGEASLGLQAGGDASEVVLLVMTERGVAALLSNSAKLGADAGIAVGPVGVGGSGDRQSERGHYRLCGGQGTLRRHPSRWRDRGDPGWVE